ncbi:hypothetical protein H0H87_002966 [Tephrocybe sp. NHM501043]|nr:hypothetical protein H0H87_002966 [Tephrocybe sp. NHM501043]
MDVLLDPRYNPQRSRQLNSSSVENNHWHGFFQAGTAWADGTAEVTQCPISPNNSFLYDFSVPDQAGTIWYHSHLSTQYCDGLRGAIVIYDPSDPYSDMYDVDDDTTVITLADWYHVPASSAGLIPTPDATLINGLGGAVDGDAVDLAVINVVKGSRYRFSIVAISCDANYIFSIDNHNMTIIEVDGVNHSPLEVDNLQIFAGQRYSVVINATQDKDNYWVRAQSNVGPTTFDGGLNSAILRYSGADDVDPVTTSALSNPLLETNLHPLENPGAPGGSDAADVQLNLDIVFANGQFSINDVVFVPPTVLVLLQILSGAHLAEELLPAGSVYTLAPNEVVELTIPGGSAGSLHPFHLHGHTFDVVRSAGTEAPSTITTIQLVFSSSIRAQTECLFPAGLAIVFAEDANSTALQPVPPAWDDLCPIYNETQSARALSQTSQT